MAELQTRWKLCFFETLKARSDINDLDKISVLFWKKRARITSETIETSLFVELRRYLEDRLALSEKELYAVAFGKHREIED